MNKYLLYTVLFIGLLFASCTDDKAFFDEIGQKVPVSLTVSFTGDVPSRDVDSKDETLDYTTDPQSAMSSDDVYVLVFSQTDNILMGLVQDLKLEPVYNNYNEKRLLGNIPADVVGQEIRLVVLANLNQNKINLGTATSVKDFLTSKVGETSQSLYQDLIYPYDNEDAPWEIIKEGKVVRRIPMWGETEKFTLPADGLSLECFLYRAIAKVNIWINGKEGINSFKINSITVNHANKGGYVVSSQKVSDDIAIQYTAPDVPALVESRGDGEKIVYENLTEDQATKAFSDVIFLPEHINSEDNQVTLTVNYDYNGKQNREKDIEFKDSEGTLFNIVRNHSYIFNIITKDIELDYTVETIPWETVLMYGAAEAYTLITDKSRLVFDANGALLTPNAEALFEVSTDHPDGWFVDDDATEANPSESTIPDWLTLEENSERTCLNVKVEINTGAGRESIFYVGAGKLLKQLIVEQQGPETANCYVVGETGDYNLNVSVKGNGTDGLTPEGMELSSTASLQPDFVKIIWETNEGLITLKTKNGEEIQSGDGDVGKLYAADFHKDGMITYHVDMSKAQIYLPDKSARINSWQDSDYDLETPVPTREIEGGNALIGAFKNTGTEGAPVYEIIWSWHIWVCPDIIASDGVTLLENAVQDWTLTGYKVLDRNLGAIDNKPGVPSMGLLYQWGRKDPFIGVAYSNDVFTGNGRIYTKNYYLNTPDEWNWIVRKKNSANANFTLTNDENDEKSLINYATKHPTQLLVRYVSSANTAFINITDKGKYLWGSAQGFVKGITDVGSKTIYDPCPVGYRVPPVDAFEFDVTQHFASASHTSWKPVENTTLTNNGRGLYIEWAKDTNGNGTLSSTENTNTRSIFEHWASVNPLNDRPDDSYTHYRVKNINGNKAKSSYTYNWNENTKYIPHYASTRSWEDGNIEYKYSGNYVKNALYYGFWLNYDHVLEPLTAYDEKTEKLHQYKLRDKNEATLTWLPLAGAYDPADYSNNAELSFKNSKDVTIGVEKGSSITVNSFLWTNSSAGSDPGAMFLHGAQKGGGTSGRHIHGIKKTDIRARKQMAGAVRCVRDVKKNFTDVNKVTGPATIAYSANSSKTGTLVSVNETWKVIDPGADWLEVTPAYGSADKGKGQTITFKALTINDTKANRSAVVKFQIGNQIFEVVVSQTYKK